MLNITKLKEIQKTRLINFRKLSELSGIPYMTLITKLERMTELKVNESETITKILRDVL